jgi:hypothetical protein
MASEKEDVTITIAKDAYASADHGIMAKVKETEKLTLLDNSKVPLGMLPESFTMRDSKLTILHLIWLKQKNKDMVFMHNRKKHLVSIHLNRS